MFLWYNLIVASSRGNVKLFFLRRGDKEKRLADTGRIRLFHKIPDWEIRDAVQPPADQKANPAKNVYGRITVMIFTDEKTGFEDDGILALHMSGCRKE